MIDVALSGKLKKTISDYLLHIKSPVRLLLFTSGKYPKAEKQTESALREIVSLNKKLSLEKYQTGSAEARKYGVNAGPAIVIDGKQKGRIRFFGFPSGYMFPIFLMDIFEASGGKQRINPEAARRAKAIKKKTVIEVFEMPSSLNAPVSVKVAHDLAMVNENVTADMVDAFLFPEMIKRYKIRDIPATVINGKLAFTGVRTIHQLLKRTG